MPSFKQTRDLLYDLITSDELLLLLEENTSHNSEFVHGQYEKFDLQSIPEPQCLSYFRFNKADIPILAEELGLPDAFHCYQRTTAGKIEGLCILRRLAFPCRYADLIPLFGRSVAELSFISNKVMDVIYNAHGHRLKYMRKEQRWQIAMA